MLQMAMRCDCDTEADESRLHFYFLKLTEGRIALGTRLRAHVSGKVPVGRRPAFIRFYELPDAVAQPRELLQVALSGNNKPASRPHRLLVPTTLLLGSATVLHLLHLSNFHDPPQPTRYALRPVLPPLVRLVSSRPFAMPKIKAYTPAWLSSPSPGYQLFAPNPDDTQNIPSYASIPASTAGPRRTIATRGTEVFIAVGKEIRWADLVYLKERWQEKAAQAAQARGGLHIKREGTDEVDDGDIIRESVENGCAEGFRVSIPPSQAVASI